MNLVTPVWATMPKFSAFWSSLSWFATGSLVFSAAISFWKFGQLQLIALFS